MPALSAVFFGAPERVYTKLGKLPDDLRDIAARAIDYIGDGRDGYADRLTAKLTGAERRKVERAIAVYFPGGGSCPGDDCPVCGDRSQHGEPWISHACRYPAEQQ